MTGYFLVRWARLFRMEPLRCSSVGRIHNVLSEREIRLLGGAFIGEVNAFVGSARWGVSINIEGSSGYYLFRILPLLSPLLPLHLLARLKHNTPSSREIRIVLLHLLTRCL